MKRIFRNKRTGKRVECDVVIDKHLIINLEKDEDYQELMYI